MRVTAIGASLTILGQTLSGNFQFEQATANGVKTITLAASNVGLSLGDGTNAFVSVSQTSTQSALFVITPSGLAGQVSANVTINIPGVATATANNIQVSINNTNAAVNQSVTLDGSTLTLNLPAGPYLQVEADGLSLTILGQSVSGNFAFTQTKATDGTNVVRIAATNVGLSLGSDPQNPLVSLTNGQGALLVTSAGIAGQIGANVATNIPNVTFSGAFSLSINTTNAAVDESFLVGGQTVLLTVPAGPFVRVDGTGVKLGVAGQTLTGDFAFEQTTDSANNKVVKVGVANLGLRLGDGTTDFVVVSGGNGALVISPAGFAGTLAATVALNIPGVTFSGTLSVSIAQTSAPLDETITVGGTPIEISVPSAGSYVKVSGTGVQLGLLGQTLSGDFAFEKVTEGNASRVVVAANNVSLNLGDGTTNFVVVTGGSGIFLFTGAGMAGQLGATVSVQGIPNVSFAGSFRLMINTTTAAVTDSLTVDGNAVSLNLPAGPYLRVEGGKDAQGNGTTVTLTVLGQTLSGDFSFTQVTTKGGRKVVSVAASNVELDLATGSQTILSITNGQGALLITPQGIAGSVSAGFSFGSAVPFTLSASVLTLEINNLTVPVNEAFTAGASTINLVLPAGPYVEAEADGLTLGFGDGVSITADVHFDQGVDSTGAKVTRLAVANVGFNGSQLGGGENRVLSNGQGGLVITSTGVAGVISGTLSGSAGPITASGTVGLRINTTGGAVNQTITVNGTAIVLNFPSGTPRYQIFVSNATVSFGNVFEVHGDVSASGDGFAGANLELFLGAGPYRNPDNSINPNAVGILLSNATVGVINPAGGGVQLHASGTIALIGVTGLDIAVQTATIDLNTSGKAVDETLTVPGQTTTQTVRVFFPNPGMTVSFVASGLTLTAGTILQIGGSVAFSKKPDGTVNVAITGASIKLNLGSSSAPAGLIARCRALGEELRAEGTDYALVFSTPARFFEAIAAHIPTLPLVTGELQFHAVGCYSVFRAVKLGVRRGEHRLRQAETFDPSADLEDAWKRVCFHQFHDTLGGTCLPSAYPQVEAGLGAAWTCADEALQYGLRRRLNALPDDAHQRMVFGNASDAPWDGWTEFEPWLDWKAWRPDTTLRDEAGVSIPWQALPSEALFGGAGWRPTRLLLRLSLPPGGLRVVTIHPSGPGENPIPAPARVSVSEDGTFANDAGVSCGADGPGTLPGLRLELIEDPTDTWSHGIDRYGDHPTALAEWDAPQVLERGPLMASLLRTGRIGESLLRAEWRVYAGEPFVELALNIAWRASSQVLKLTLPLSHSPADRTDGILGGHLVRPNSGAESPLRDWTLFLNGLGVVCPDVFALDATPTRARFTLLRAVPLAFHDPYAGLFNRSVVSDQGPHTFRFRFFPVGADVERLESHALMFHRPLLAADLTRGMPADHRMPG